MWTELLRTLTADEPPDSWDMSSVAALMLRATPAALAVTIDPARELPWGRYLAHADARGRWNLQLDVFSRGYEGTIHAHDTWGVFWILRGTLHAWDYAVAGATATLVRAATLGPGAGQCFCPPASDWHRVATPPDGAQTVSLHLYGPGFDLDAGVTLGPGGPLRYRRGPLRPLADVRDALREPAA